MLFNGAFTVTVQLAVQLPTFAMIVVLPGALAVIVPSVPTVATDVEDEVHVTVLVSVVFVGLYVTLSFSVPPTFNVVEVLFRLMLFNGAFTVTVQLAVKLPTFAVMVAVPGALAVIVPSVPMVATDVAEEVQVTVFESVVFVGL